MIFIVNVWFLGTSNSFKNLYGKCKKDQINSNLKTFILLKVFACNASTDMSMSSAEL